MHNERPKTHTAHGTAPSRGTDLAARWNAVYFDGQLSPAVVGILGKMPNATSEACAFVERAFRLMRMARFEARDVSPLFAWQLSVVAPSFLPGAWDGMIPPITSAGRHERIDEHIAGNAWHRPVGEPVLLDLGCRFPPLTTVDSATRLSDWRVIGADPSFGRYLVYDAQGDYACYGSEKHLRYFQAGVADPDRLAALHHDRQATRQRFDRLLLRLRPRIRTPSMTELQEVESDGARLVRNPVRRFESAKLSFVQGGIGSLELDGPVDVIRCMNVLMYFDRAFRAPTLAWAAPLLRPGGLFICGTNWVRSASSRYTVYQKENGALLPREFAFGIDNVRSIDMSPWYALHDDDIEALSLATSVGVLRATVDYRSALRRANGPSARRAGCMRSRRRRLPGRARSGTHGARANGRSPCHDHCARRGERTGDGCGRGVAAERP